jgi:signal transduction histidine kinase
MPVKEGAETVTLPRAEWEALQKRTAKLAGDKSYLQLLVNMMQQMGAVAGLENVADAMPRVVMENIGGTNLILYYFIDQDVFRTDLYGNKARLDAIDDPDVARTASTRDMAEYQCNPADSRMTGSMAPNAWTWVFPLLVGDELIGVFKIENLQISTREWRKQLPTFFNYAALILKNEILGHTRLQKTYHELEHEVATRQQAEEELRTTNEELKFKLDTLLEPDTEIDEEKLINIINTNELQTMMDVFQNISQVAMAIVDLKGNILVRAGWKEVCSKYHRMHPQTRENCRESDMELSCGLSEGQSRAYHCKNNMWDVATPLFIGKKHVANIFIGQFFYEDEPPELALFATQAEKYGFDKDSYLSAVRQAPLLSRKKVADLITFYSLLATHVSKLSFSNVMLARTLLENQHIESALREAKEGLERTVAERTAELRASSMRLLELNAVLDERVQEEVTNNRKKDLILIQQSRLAAMGEMVHNIAHQWRQPINTLGLILANIRDAYAYNDLTKEFLDEEMTTGRQLIDQMSKTIDDFRNFFRPDREPQPFEVGQAVENALSVMQASLNNNFIIVEKALPPGITVSGFPSQFAQVVLNILTNAKEAIRQNDRQDGRIEIALRVGDDMAILTICDNGGGIPPDALPRIFDPYYTTKTQGSGIGLYMSKMIMDHMGGEITAYNAGKGAEFTLTLPLHQPPRA